MCPASRVARTILIIVASLPWLVMPLAAQVRRSSDSANYPAYLFDRLREEVLFIDQLDFDAQPDTVLGRHVGMNDTYRHHAGCAVF